MNTRRVLLLSRATLLRDPGGDTLQMQKLAQHLTGFGWQADIRLADETIDHSRYDLVHLFNAFRPADLIKHAEAARCPIVVSPIYVDYSSYERSARAGLAGLVAKWLSTGGIEYAKVLARWVRNGEAIVSPDYLWLGHRRAVQWVLNRAALLLPQSEHEMRRVEHDFEFSGAYRVTPVGIEPDELRLAAHAPDKRYHDAVVCVGRIEGRKNQLGLVRALRGTGLRLVLVGQASPNHRAYAEACRREGGTGVEFAGQLPHDQVLRHLAAARVHALPSHFETCGLSSLEAAALGTRIVVGDRGDVRDYFGEHAVYCDPERIESIREAVQHAYATAPSAGFAEQILQRFTWAEMARLTAEAYAEVLG